MRNYLKIVSLTCFLIFASFPLSAQSFDDYRKAALSDFNAYKEKTIKDFEAYRDKVNADFAEYMRKAWEWKEGKPAVPKPEPKVPDVPPVVLPDIDIPDVPDDNEIPFENLIPIVIDDAPIPIIPIKPVPKPDESKYTVVYYGTECQVRFDPKKKFQMNGASEDAAADMWSAMAKDDYTNLLADCLNVKENLALCDWGYYTFLDGVCDKIYGKSNEAVMLKAFLLSQSGYKVRLARNNGGVIKLLISLTDDLYGFGYFELDGTHYYLTDKNSESSLYIFDQEFPNEKSLRMSISSAARFADKKSDARELCSRRYPDIVVSPSFNENLLGFYDDYPSSYMRDQNFSQWVFYANTPISEAVKAKVYPKLEASIKGKTQSEAANILINFVQTAFEYKTDDEMWGYERSFFPEETLFYPYSDCEDRAILYSRLVRDLMGLKVVLLYYPGHLASAVAFTEPVTGDYLNVAGTKYLVCDPTYINANIGMTMPDKDNSKAVVVMLE